MTSENTINDRRNWKAQTFPYDHYIPDETEECLYCLTEKQAELLRGIIEPVAWRTRWWSELGHEIEIDEIENLRADITRRLIMSCCADENPIIYRYTEDGVLQRSTDNGETWEDAPQDDIRTNAPQFPPTSDDKCIAARGMKNLIKEQVGDNLTDGMSRYTLSQLIADWVSTMIGTSNPFQALLTVVTNQIFALVISVVRPALTEEVYKQLQCIFYCNMSSDISFTGEQWETIRGQITSQITGVAGIFLEHLVYLLGFAGVTNLARAYGATAGDCSECCPTCADKMIVQFGTNVIRDGNIVSADSVFDGTHHTININSINFTGKDDCCYINSVVTTGYGQPVDFIRCGEETLQIGMIGPECVNAVVLFQDSGPFSAVFEFGDCPP